MIEMHVLTLLFILLMVVATTVLLIGYWVCEEDNKKTPKRISTAKSDNRLNA